MRMSPLRSQYDIGLKREGSYGRSAIEAPQSRVHSARAHAVRSPLRHHVNLREGSIRKLRVAFLGINV